MTQTTAKAKLVKDLQPGDVVVTEQGDRVRITKIARGFWDNSKIVEWYRGSRKNAYTIQANRWWACANGDDLVEVADDTDHG